MNIALGFGSTEQAFERAEEDAIREHIEAQYRELRPDYFDDKFVEEIRAFVKERADALHTKAKGHDDALDPPERYSHYWPYVLADANYIVVILSVHHINRRHPFSPDGWALLQTKPTFTFYKLDIEDAVQ